MEFDLDMLKSVVSLMGSFGAPTILCVLMFFFMTKFIKSYNANMLLLTEQLDNASEALVNNTKIIQALLDRLNERK